MADETRFAASKPLSPVCEVCGRRLILALDKSWFCRCRDAHERRWWRRWFFIFEPRDLWIGVFVSPEKYDEASGDFVQRTYFALIPTVVLVWQRWRSGV